MGRTCKIVIAVLITLCVLLVALGIWQRENIAALIDGIRYSQEDITSLINENDKIISDAMNDYPDMDVREANDEEIKALEKGQITEDDLVQIVTGQTSLEEAVESNKNNSVPSSTGGKTEKPKPNNNSPSAPANNGDAEVAALVGKIYVLKSTYVGRLEGLIGEAKSEFSALPAEKRTASSKQKILSSKLSKAAGMEAECNAQIESILSELTTVLKKYGKDMALVDSIRTAYANEKQLKKSYYISKYLN